jgi:hypothetical protein
MQEHGVTSNDITFIQDFVEIGQLVRKLEGGTRGEHGDLLNLLFFLTKGK